MRRLRPLLPWVLAVGFAAACTSQSPAPSPGQDTGGVAPGGGPTAAIQVPVGIQPASGSPAGPNTAASPGAAPATTPTSQAAGGPRREPQGRVVYVWHTALSPAWVDPDENQAVITPFVVQYALHDAVVKPLPGQAFAPSLAESYEIAPDYRSATFRLRSNITFHDGSPVTS